MKKICLAGIVFLSVFSCSSYQSSNTQRVLAQVRYGQILGCSGNGICTIAAVGGATSMIMAPVYVSCGDGSTITLAFNIKEAEKAGFNVPSNGKYPAPLGYKLADLKNLLCNNMFINDTTGSYSQAGDSGFLKIAIAVTSPIH